MDWAGAIVWESERASYHHGFSQDDRGRIYAVATRKRMLRHDGQEITVADNYIAVLSPNGTSIDQISMFDLLGQERISRDQLDLLAGIVSKQAPNRDRLVEELAVDSARDVFHLNSISVIDKDIGIATKGMLLICLRSLDLILVVDPERRRVVWEWKSGQELLDRPHRPMLLDSGNILIFDNGWRRGYSRVVELNPRSEEIVWQYTATPKASFYTKRGGMAQPLPGGNILITEAGSGHVFEINREGDVVWDFWNPRFENDGKKRRQTIYRAWRWGRDDLAKLKMGDFKHELAERGYLE